MTQQQLKKHLHYAPLTGVFTWISGQYKGSVAGSINNDHYVAITINYKRYPAHRLAWLYYHGVMPDVIDHNDRNRSNNRILNLNNGTHHTNAINRAKQSNNKSGHNGVRQVKSGNWEACIDVKRKRINLGTYSIYDDAVKVRKEAELLYGFHPNHGN